MTRRLPSVSPSKADGVMWGEKHTTQKRGPSYRESPKVVPVNTQTKQGERTQSIKAPSSQRKSKVVPPDTQIKHIKTQSTKAPSSQQKPKVHTQDIILQQKKKPDKHTSWFSTLSSFFSPKRTEKRGSSTKIHQSGGDVFTLLQDLEKNTMITHPKEKTHHNKE